MTDMPANVGLDPTPVCVADKESGHAKYIGEVVFVQRSTEKDALFLSQKLVEGFRGGLIHCFLKYCNFLIGVAAGELEFVSTCKVSTCEVSTFEVLQDQALSITHLISNVTKFPHNSFEVGLKCCRVVSKKRGHVTEGFIDENIPPSYNNCSCPGSRTFS
jgi:hypothetical protein